MLAIHLEEDLVVCHVNGARKYNLCFSVGRLIKTFKIALKLNDFGKYAKAKMMIEVQ